MKEWESAYVAGIIDGEGSIALTRMHRNEQRRPCITVASTDRELLEYIQSLTGGIINNKKNYNTLKHKDSFTLSIKRKAEVFRTLNQILPYLRVIKKRKRANWIIENYENVTPRNGKYNKHLLQKKQFFEENFFKL